MIWNLKKTKITMIIAISLLCMISLSVPSFTYAGEGKATKVNGKQVYMTDYSDAEIEQILNAQIQAEVKEIISEDTSKGISTRASGRVTYTTKTGSTKLVKAPYRKVAGQPPGGINFTTGGMIYVDWSGGTSFSFSYSFPTPYGSIGISATPGKKIGSAKGLSVTIPASKNNYYLVYMANIYKCKPYIVYKVVNGKKSVYYKGVSKTRYKSSFDVRKAK